MKIGIVSVLPEVIAMLQQSLLLRPAHTVLWIAHDNARALQLCVENRPELLLMDLTDPAQGALEAIGKIMEMTPCAVLLVTRDVSANSARVFDAMGFGAIDVVDTLRFIPGSQLGSTPFLRKIDTIDRLLAIPKFLPKTDNLADTVSLRRMERLVAIGASAGGPGALATILAGLPADFPSAIVIVQHVDKYFATGMAAWLNLQSKLPVRIAVEGDLLVVGTVLLAATNDHLKLTAVDRIGYTSVPRDLPHRPSVDVFFESICMSWRGDAVGVLLTGMGRDGALGLKALRDKGHYTIAQNRATSAAYGMPKAAIALGAAVDILPIQRIAGRLIETFGNKG